TGQFYAQSFLENVCGVDFDQSRTILIWGILFATPFFVVFGGLSDKIGRKWIMLIGMLVAICSYQYIFKQFLTLTSPEGKTELTDHRKLLEDKVIVSPANPADSIHLVTSEVHYNDGAVFKEVKADTLFSDASRAAVTKTSIKYKDKKLNTWAYRKLIVWIFVLILYVTMVYGPIAAFLVEMFPTRIRYTSMSLPYHIGNGVFGGLTPFIATLLTTIYVTDKLSGLWYTIIIGAVCLFIGAIYISNRIDPDVND
ncbi:MAG TPA: MFS transporter, partial [Niastella sp.]